MKGALRRRYSLLVSGGYVALGAAIAIRSVLAHVAPLALLGVIFIALGAVRIRDYLRWRSRIGGS